MGDVLISDEEIKRIWLKNNRLQYQDDLPKLEREVMILGWLGLFRGQIEALLKAQEEECLGKQVVMDLR